MITKKHMLIIEDDVDGQMLVSTLLGHLSISVDIASDAAQAEYFLFQTDTNYDGIIIDLALPDKDGWQVLSEILGDPQRATVPCISITAYHTSKLREDAMLAGFKAYFPKPLDDVKFLRELESVLK